MRNDVFDRPLLTRLFPMPRVTMFVADIGEGIDVFMYGKDGGFPDDNKYMMYPTHKSTTRNESKNGETPATFARFAQFIL